MSKKDLQDQFLSIIGQNTLSDQDVMRYLEWGKGDI